MTEALLIHKFQPGDRVKVITNMGWLKRDTIGVVTGVFDKDDTDRDAFFRYESDTIIVAWPKSAYVTDLDGSVSAWDGKVYGVGQIDIREFEKPSYELPMQPHEIAFIDNLLHF